MSYPLAFHLLESALAFCKIGQDDQDVRELINWIRIGNNAYCLNEIDSFLNDQTDLSSKVKQSGFIVLSICNLFQFTDSGRVAQSNERKCNTK